MESTVFNEESAQERETLSNDEKLFGGLRIGREDWPHEFYVKEQDIAAATSMSDIYQGHIVAVNCDRPWKLPYRVSDVQNNTIRTEFVLEPCVADHKQITVRGSAHNSLRFHYSGREETERKATLHHVADTKVGEALGKSNLLLQYGINKLS